MSYSWSLAEDATEPRSKDEIQEQNISKQQAVLQIDFEDWENIIDAFQIFNAVLNTTQILNFPPVDISLAVFSLGCNVRERA